MKLKTLAIIGAALLAIGGITAGIHHAKNGEMCPLGKAIHGKSAQATK